MTEITRLRACQLLKNSETSPRYRRPTIQQRKHHHGGHVMSDSISSQFAACSESEDGSFLAQDVYDIIKGIKDPEFPQTLEELNVVDEGCIKVQTVGIEEYVVTIDFTPTTPHCSLATLIGLCLRVKLERSLPQKFKLDIYLAKGTHSTEEEINKQINDKERIAAAMENPNLREIVENCIKEDDSG